MKLNNLFKHTLANGEQRFEHKSAFRPSPFDLTAALELSPSKHIKTPFLTKDFLTPQPAVIPIC